LQRAAECRGHVLARLLKAGRDQGGESPREFIDGLHVDHRCSPVASMW